MNCITWTARQAHPRDQQGRRFPKQPNSPPLPLPQLREQNHFTDGGHAGEQHDQAVQAGGPLQSVNRLLALSQPDNFDYGEGGGVPGVV